MNDIIYRQFSKEDKERFLNFQLPGWAKENSVVGDWWIQWVEKEDFTASLAIVGDKVVGAIPLHKRDFQIARQTFIKAAFEHAVSVSEEMRGQGIGTNMVKCAKEFLRDDCNAMMVYRGDERSAAYRFYRKSGHYDLQYTREFILKEPRAYEDKDIQHKSVEDISKMEESLLTLFNSTYENYGGFPARYEGFWSKALCSKSYTVYPREYKHMTVLYLSVNRKSKGYLVSAEWRDKRLHILEMATEGGNEEYGKRLLKAAGNLAAGRKGEVVLITSDATPYRNALREAGFLERPRSMVTLGFLVNKQKTVEKVWQDNKSLDNIEVRVWTPREELLLHASKSKEPDRVITLEMKDETLTRLLLSRIDVLSAIKEERITLHSGSEVLVKEIAKALPFAKWTYQEIDFL